MKNTYQQIKDEFQGGSIYILLSAISKMCIDQTRQGTIIHNPIMEIADNIQL